jgi:hypothetical protein
MQYLTKGSAQLLAVRTHDVCLVLGCSAVQLYIVVLDYLSSPAW